MWMIQPRRYSKPISPLFMQNRSSLDGESEPIDMNEALSQTHLEGLQLLQRGKVRDVYDLGDTLLMVATDRISAFDVVMPQPVPDKGKVLNQISVFWFEIMAPLVKNHLISADPKDFPFECRPYSQILQGRSMLVQKTKPLPIECVVRGYLSGSGWSSYQSSQEICGIQLPPGLKESDQLPEPIFTPSTKEAIGTHDVNISFDETCQRIGSALAEKVRTLSLAIYARGAALALEKGIIIADTKFEFGLAGDDIILIDEVLTPDSSRFWPQQGYKPGGAQPSFDKQYLRDYLKAIKWNQKPPAPDLPADVIENTRLKYIEAMRLLTGQQHGI
jgi:phosphoribosylaminoimidazole-succinocarboxamide synthase